MKKEIKKAVSKSKKLKLWEQIYQVEKQIKELKERIAELEKKLGDLYSPISEETKVSSFKSNDMTDLFKNIKIDHLELSSMDTTYATNMINMDLRYLECELKRAEKEIKELKERITELKKESKPIWFVPEKGEIFFYVDTYGNVTWKIAGFDSNKILEHNQVFKTEEEALDYSEYKKAEVSIKKRIAELNKGWRPDWEKDIQQKYYIFYDNLREILDYDYCYTGQFLPNAFYLKDQKTARQIIYELEEELKLYLRY